MPDLLRDLLRDCQRFSALERERLLSPLLPDMVATLAASEHNLVTAAEDLTRMGLRWNRHAWHRLCIGLQASCGSRCLAMLSLFFRLFLQPC
jgi:hypothetical protein